MYPARLYAARRIGNEQADIARGSQFRGENFPYEEGYWVSGPKQFWRTTMSSLKSFMIVAALLTGGTSLAIAQSGRPTPPAAGGTAGNPAPALKRQCVGIRHGLTEQASNQNVAGFDAKIGTFVPTSVKAEPMPS